MVEQSITAKIINNKIGAEIHAESLETAIEMFMELARAICTRAEKARLMPSREVCGTLLGYIIANEYMTEDAVAMLGEALREVGVDMRLN